VLAPLTALVRRMDMDIGQLRVGYRRFHEADRAFCALRDELARHNLRLVIAMARKYERPGMPLGDLIQEGNVGLLRAIDKFDPELGYRFSTYATWWVRQSLQRAQLEQVRVVRVPAHVQDEARLLYRTTETFVHEHGREPRNDELVRLSGLSLSRVDVLRALFTETLSLDAPRHDDGDESWHAHIADAVEGADVERERAELGVQLDRLLQSLPNEQAQLLRLRFGVGLRGEHTPEMLRAVLKLSPARLRELEQQALGALRERGEGLRAFLE
jgi:RNA polymerase primary sigma factor